MFHYWVAKVAGSYVAAMNGVDAIIFTAGVGENSKASRAAISEYFGYLGVKIDNEANSKRGEDIMISTPRLQGQGFRYPHQRGACYRPRHQRYRRLIGFVKRMK